MNTILIPTDFSSAAINAMNYALDLAAKEESKVILLHVIPEQTLKKNTEESIAAANEELISLHSQIAESKKIGCERVLLKGEVEKEILRVAEERKPDLVVIGMRGEGEGLSRVIGRTARKIIENAKCPVMAIPEKASFKEINNITYATDYHQSDMEALNKLTEMAGPFNANIKLLHIANNDQASDSGADLLEKFRKKVVKTTGYKNFSCRFLPGRNIQKELEEYARHDSTDLLVMSTHHRSIIDRIFGKSITKQVTFHTSVPLLVFHHKEKPVIFIFGMAIMK